MCLFLNLRLKVRQLKLSMYNAKTCIGYKLDLYKFTFDLNIYSSINNSSILEYPGHSLNDEHIAIVHTKKHCFL